MQKVKLNIVPKGVKKAAYLSQNDNGRVVRYELFNELVPYTLDGSETITVKVVRPDGEEILANIENTFEGKAYIDVTFNDDMSAIAGVGAGEIKITDGETVLGSHNFDINVEIDAYNGKDVVIETATGVIASFNTEVEDNALEYESEIPYNAKGYTGLRVINTRTAPVYDKTPYLFRKTPSGNSCIEKLNGLTVAFNQLFNINDVTASTLNGITYTPSDNKVIISGTSTARSNKEIGRSLTGVNHKILVCGIPAGATQQTYYAVVNEFENNTYKKTNYITRDNIINISTSSVNTMRFEIVGAQNADLTVDNIIFTPQIFDLTQMFGSTIADYLYTLETQTAGAGVSLFKSLGFDKSYYPYNAGELMSVKTSGRKTIGFNQWDEEWESGTIDGNGNNASDNTRIRSKNYIHCFPNMAYYFKSSKQLGLRFYDSNKNFIGLTTAQNSIVTIPDSVNFMRFAVVDTTIYNHDICINISDPARNGQYEPYNAVTYPLDPDLELRGIPKLDANNKLYGDGDIYESSGDATRRYGIVDLGSLDWLYGDAEGHKRFYVRRENLPADMRFPSSTSIANVLCKKYVTDTASHVYGNVSNKTIGVGDSISEALNIMDLDYNDVSTFTASLDGVYLLYEKATPTSESADPYTDPQEVKITEEFIDERSIPIPVGHDTIYGTDIEYQDIDFDTTIFGGDINAIDGVLTSRYNSDGSVKTTPEIIDITPTPIPVRAGDNVIFNSADGGQTIRYYNQVE